MQRFKSDLPVHENGDFWVRKADKGFEVYEVSGTHSRRCAVIDFQGDHGLKRAIAECDRRAAAAKIPAIPAGVYWSREAGNFYSAETNIGMGLAFYDVWQDRKEEFPEKVTGAPGLDLFLDAPAVMPNHRQGQFDLPEGIRVPLHQLQADAAYLFGRVAQDADVASAMSDSVLERLSQIETAVYHLLADECGLRSALALILPLAKGYAAANPVGRNAEYIRSAEAAIAKAEGRS